MPLIRKREKQFYGGLDIKDVTDNKKFWKTIKPLFSDKTKLSNNHITRDKKVVTDNSEIAKTLNSYFINVVKSLEIPDVRNIDQLY